MKCDVCRQDVPNKEVLYLSISKPVDSGNTFKEIVEQFTLCSRCKTLGVVVLPFGVYRA